MICPHCKSPCTIKYGCYKQYQKYKCNSCDKQFSERSFSFFYRARFPEKIIMNAVLLVCFVSTRIAKFLLLETTNVGISHQTIYNWSKKFASKVGKIRRQMNYSNVWHVDEKFIKVRNSKDDFAYLWVVIDDNNTIIAEHVSFERDTNNARIVLKKALDKSVKPPDILVSDGLQAYKKACKKKLGNTKHVVAHF